MPLQRATFRLGVILCALCALPSHAADEIYRCARDFDNVLGSYLWLNDGVWTNYGSEYRPQDWHHVDADEVLTNYNEAEYIRTWWEGACSVQLADADDAEYRLWIWARDDSERDMRISVSTSLDPTSRIVAHEDREGWYDCGVVSLKRSVKINVQRFDTDHPTAWSLVRAIYLTKDTTSVPPTFDAEPRSIPTTLGDYTYRLPNRVDRDWVLQWQHTRTPGTWIVASPDSLSRLREAFLRPEIAPIVQTIINRADAYEWKSADVFWLQGNWTHYPHAVDCAIAYMVTGDTAYAAKAVDPLLAHMRQHALAFDRKPPSGESWHRHNNTLGKFFRQCLQVYDIIAPTNVLSPTEDREIRALFASLAYYMERHGDGKLGNNVTTGGGYWWWNGNTDRYTSVGLSGLLFPDHPRSSDWTSNANDGFTAQMEYNVRPDGTWPESSNYALVTMAAVNPYLMASVHSAAGRETLNQEQVRRFYDWHVRTTSPKIPNWWRDLLPSVGPTGDFRQDMLENWMHLSDTVRLSQGTGESGFNNEYGSLLLTASALYRDIDSDFASQLKWAWEEWGGQLLTEADLITCLVGFARAFDIVSQEPLRESERIDGYAILRDKPGEPEEIALFVDAQLKRSHGYPDLGQYHLYAYGVPITKDWDLNGKSEWYETRYWNVPWASNVPKYPLNYTTDTVCKLVSPTLTDDDVFFTQIADAVQVDYGKVTSAIGLYRNYVLVKSGMDGARGVPYIVVFDDTPSNREILQTCYAVATSYSRDASVVRFDGTWDIDYEIHYLSGDVDDGESWIESYFAENSILPFRWRPDLTMMGRSALRKTPSLGDWAWIGYPRREGMSDMVATTSSVVASSGHDIQRVEVAIGEVFDTVILASEKTSYDFVDISFNGRYGILRHQTDSNFVTLACLGGGSISNDSVLVGYDNGSVSMTFFDDIAVGDFSGSGGLLRVARPEFGIEPEGIEVDGISAPYWLVDDTAHVKVPTGRHSVVVGVGEPVIIVGVTDMTKLEFTLQHNRPNPFNPTTRIRFSLPESSPVSLTVYDVNGRLVRTLVDGNRAAGMHEVVWDARDDAGRAVASGVYVYRLTNQREAMVRRMVLVR